MAAPSPAVAKRSFGLRVLSVLGKLFALAGTVALTFQFGARGLAAGLLFGFVIPWLIALRPKAPLRRDPFRKHGVRPLTWRPQVRFWPILSGLLAGLGTVAVLQQFSIQAMTSALLVRGLAGGLLGGVLIPSITWYFAVKRVNARLGRPVAAAGATAMLAVLGGLLVVLPASAAFAEVSGGCTAFLNFIDVADVDSTDEDQAVVLHAEDTASFVLASDLPATDGEFRLHYGPFSAPIDADVQEGNQIVASAPVDDYDWMGAGYYIVTGRSTLADGSTCEGAVMVDIPDADPLTTLAGATAATLAAAGLMGVIGSSLHDSSDSRRALKRYRDGLAASSPGAAMSASPGVVDAGPGPGTGPGVVPEATAALASTAAAGPETRADWQADSAGFYMTPQSDVEEAAAAGALAGAAAASSRPGSGDREEETKPAPETGPSAPATGEFASAQAEPLPDGLETPEAAGGTGERPGGEVPGGEVPGGDRPGQLPDRTRQGGLGGGLDDAPSGGPGTGAGAGAPPEPGGGGGEVEFGLGEEAVERVLDPDAFEHDVTVPPGEEDEEPERRREDGVPPPPPPPV